MPNNYQLSKGLVRHENLVSQELIEVKFTEKSVTKLAFRALALRQSESAS